jgi:hypothetical protein
MTILDNPGVLNPVEADFGIFVGIEKQLCARILDDGVTAQG